MPTRRPPQAVAKTTAGKSGMKKTSGRNSARHHRAPVARTRQDAANPILKSVEGCDVPCQPRRSSSIHFTMTLTLHQPVGESTTRPAPEQGRRSASANFRVEMAEWQAWLALFPLAGDI